MDAPQNLKPLHHTFARSHSPSASYIGLAPLNDREFTWVRRPRAHVALALQSLVFHRCVLQHATMEGHKVIMSSINLTGLVSPKASPRVDIPTLQQQPHTLPSNSNRLRRDRTGMTKLYWKGYEYTRANISKVKITYRCSFYRSEKCDARLDYCFAEGGYFDYQNQIEHACSRRVETKVEQSTDGATVTAGNVATAMKSEIDRIAISNTMSPQEACLDVSRRFLYSSSVPVSGLSRNQAIKRFHNARSRHYGSSISGKVETPPLALVVGTQLYFFQFHYVWQAVGKISNKAKRPIDRIVGWAHPALIRLLSYSKITVLADGTFDCVPVGFQQCIIFMVFDEASQLYIPIFYVLSTSKAKEAYLHVVQVIDNACVRPVAPAQVVCDFEQALIDVMSEWYPEETSIVGCYFHFKKACQRKMVQLRISNPEVKIATGCGVLDMLTVLPHDHIWPRGAIWVRDKIMEDCAAANMKYSRNEWRAFWRYFERTWIKRYKPEVWNVWDFVSQSGKEYKNGAGKRLVSRTNNPLERFNRTLNQAFGAPHPPLENFVRTIERISRDYVQLKNAVMIGDAEAPDRRTPLELPKPICLSDDTPSNWEDDMCGLSDDEVHDSDEDDSDGSGNESAN